MPERRLEREARLVCPDCQGAPFLLWRRETRPESGIFEHVLWPAHPDVPPPVNPERLTCPDCRAELRWSA
jgi:uncharacterized protein YbaR (Trm112 family)